MEGVSEEAILVVVKLTPKSSKNRILGWEMGVLRVAVQAAPEKGLANQQLIEFLAETLHVAKKKITLVRGETSRLKTLRIEGIERKEWVGLCAF